MCLMSITTLLHHRFFWPELKFQGEDWIWKVIPVNQPQIYCMQGKHRRTLKTTYTTKIAGEISTQTNPQVFHKCSTSETNRTDSLS